MYALLLSLSAALAGEPCAPQGDPALPIPLDSTFTPVEFGPLGSELIETGFTFRFYGRDYNSAWVNANGTISFCQPVLPDIGTGIPSLGRPLIAPFWAASAPQECQFMPGSGRAWVRHDANRLVVVWDHVGYEGMSDPGHTPRSNTFQVILSDGNDPVVGSRRNVLFAYGDMGWTGADSTGGTDGFGGSPAYVGVDAGDGVIGELVGRFRHDTAVFSTPETDSGVHWLDSKSFSFDTRTPVAGDIPTLGVEDYSTWVREDLYVLRSAISGPAMVRKNAWLEYFTMASDPRVGPERRALITRKDLHMAFGNILNGSVQYGEDAFIDTSVGFQNTSLTPLNAPSPSEEHRIEWFENLMEVLAFFAPGGVASFDGDTVHLIGSDPALNTFSVDTDTLAAADRILAQVPSGSRVALTVHGGADNNTNASLASFGFDLQGITGMDLLVVMPDLYGCVLDQVDFKGSLLAPSAVVEAQYIRIYGQVIARKLELVDSTLHGTPMTGCFCLADLAMTADLVFSADDLPTDQPGMEVRVELEPDGWITIAPGSLPNSVCLNVHGKEPRDLNLERISRIVVHGAADASRVRRSLQLDIPVLVAESDLVPRPDAVRAKRSTPVEFDVLANDSAPLLLAPKVLVTELPAFGELEEQGDGRFRYTSTRKFRHPVQDVMKYRLFVEEGQPSHEVEVRFFIGAS